MDLEPHLLSLRRALASAASVGGTEAEALLERFALPLDAAFRLAMLDVVADAAGEISQAIAPGRVEVRWRDRNPDLVVTPAVASPAADDVTPDVTPVAEPEEDDDVPARVSLRLPARLKNHVDELAAQAGLSSNAWLVRAVAAAAAAEAQRPARPGLHVGQRQSGWSS